jgi:hypothetical protein
MWLQASDDVKFGRPLTHQRQEAIRRLRRARAGRSYGVSQATISTLAVPNLSRQARPAREKEMSEARLIQERLRTPQQNQWFYTGRIPGDSAVFTLPLARGSIFAPRSLQAPMASSTSGSRQAPPPQARPPPRSTARRLPEREMHRGPSWWRTGSASSKWTGPAALPPVPALLASDGGAWRGSNCQGVGRSVQS